MGAGRTSPETNHPTASRPLNIAVVGLGVVGGSIARALYDSGYNVVGWDLDARQGDKASAYGVIVGSTLYNTVRYADVVFCCGPVSQIGEIARASVPHMDSAGLVIDVGSTKEQPVRDMRAACLAVGRNDLTVIGTHPMSGSEKSGFAHSDASLFAGCTWVLTPERDPDEDPQTRGWLEVLAALLRVLGAASVPVMDAQVHDRTVAACSHLVQAAATCVAATVGAAAADATLPVFELSAGGFRDTTRVAESPASMWVPILTGNAGNVVPLLRDLSNRISVLADAVEDGDVASLEVTFRDAQNARAEWQAQQERR